MILTRCHVNHAIKLTLITSAVSHAQDQCILSVQVVQMGYFILQKMEHVEMHVLVEVDISTTLQPNSAEVAIQDASIVQAQTLKKIAIIQTNMTPTVCWENSRVKHKHNRCQCLCNLLAIQHTLSQWPLLFSQELLRWVLQLSSHIWDFLACTST